MRKIKFFVVFVFLAVLSFQRIRAAFHLWAVSELYSSPDGSVQFIQLTNNAILEAQLGGHVITCAGPQGTNVFTFPTNLPSTATANKSFLIGTPNLSAIPGGVVPDYVFTNADPFLIRSANSQIIVGIGGSFVLPAAYTNLPSDGSSALVGTSSNLSITINSAKNFNGQSNTIVPVKFSSAKVVGTNFVMTFPTATGVNGTAGTNYTVDFKNLLTDPAWAPLTTVTGDGTVKSVSNAISSAQQRVYRLRAP